MRDCRAGRAYAGKTFANFTGGGNITRRLGKAVADGESVLLTGGVGAGKTHLACAMLRERGLLRGWEGLRFTTVPELLLELRHAFSGHCRATEKDAVDFYGSRAFLVLDDLGAEKPSEFSAASLSLILDRRIREGLPTVVTTNLTLAEIGDAAGERISSRLCEFYLVALSAPDFRRRAGA